VVTEIVHHDDVAWFQSRAEHPVEVREEDIGVGDRFNGHPTEEHQTKAMDKMEQFVSEQKIIHAERIAPQTSFAIQ
jgi:hypothetical protein